MRLPLFVAIAGVLLLVPSIGCRSNRTTQAKPDAGPSPQAEAIASAQAMASALAAQAQTSITGHVHSVGGELGTWDITLSDCQSGEYNGFYGVDFYAPGSDEMRIRYVHDEAKGDIVKVAIPSKKDRVLVLDHEAKCAVLDGQLEKTNYSTWTPKGKIRHLDGRVKFDCKITGGKGHVAGEATFSHCH